VLLNVLLINDGSTPTSWAWPAWGPSRQVGRYLLTATMTDCIQPEETEVLSGLLWD